MVSKGIFLTHHAQNLIKCSLLRILKNFWFKFNLLAHTVYFCFVVLWTWVILGVQSYE